jgi:hypothetical protein
MLLGSGRGNSICGHVLCEMLLRYTICQPVAVYGGGAGISIADMDEANVSLNSYKIHG